MRFTLQRALNFCLTKLAKVFCCLTLLGKNLAEININYYLSQGVKQQNEGNLKLQYNTKHSKRCSAFKWISPLGTILVAHFQVHSFGIFFSTHNRSINVKKINHPYVLSRALGGTVILGLLYHYQTTHRQFHPIVRHIFQDAPFSQNFQHTQYYKLIK